MAMEFVIARNPDASSSLPYLVRLPFGRDGIALKVRETWPRTSKVYCHRADDWPDDVEVIERVPVRSCERRGAAIDLVLDRGREHRSQFVFAMARGREVIFWQSARTAKQARPAVSLPTARAAGRVLEVLVDSHERYAWRFEQQQTTTVRRGLPAGDYAVAVDGGIIAAVERKSLADLVSTLTTGKLRYLLADLAALPRAAVVVEDRWSSVFKLDRVRPTVVAEGLAEAQVRFPPRADRVLRDPQTRPGVDLPLPRRSPRPPLRLAPRRRTCRRTADGRCRATAGAHSRDPCLGAGQRLRRARPRPPAPRDPRCLSRRDW